MAIGFAESSVKDRVQELMDNEEVVGFICDEFSSKSLKPETFEKCSTELFVENESIMPIQIIQTAPFDTIEYRQCLVSYNITSGSCKDLTADKEIIGGLSTAYMLDVTREQCIGMHNSKNYKDPSRKFFPLHINNGKGSTRKFIASGCHENSPDYPYDGFTHVEIKVRISSGTGKIQGKDLILENEIKCDFGLGQCIDKYNGHTFWDMIPNKLCQKENFLSLAYEGDVQSTIHGFKAQDAIYEMHRFSWVFVDRHQKYFGLEFFSPFSLANENNKYIDLCGIKVLRTDHPFMFVRYPGKF
jgi:hypothetical protein